MILSNRLFRNLSQTSILPLMVLEIEGVPFLIGSDTIKRFPRYGDDNLEYGDAGLFYGGTVPEPNQKTLISLDGTTTQIKQTLEPDKARGASVSQMRIRLIDKRGEGTKLLAGNYGEILFKRVKVWITFGNDSAFNDDYILVFRGFVESAQSEQGSVSLFLSSPDQKKRAQAFIKADTDLSSGITSGQTNLFVESSDGFFTIPAHPQFLGPDPDIKTYLKINDELMEFDEIDGNEIKGLVRGALDTTAAAHAGGDQVESFLLVQGNAMDVALKLMLSDSSMSSYLTIDASRVNWSGFDVLANSFFFPDINISRAHNIKIGDFVRTSGFTEGANNLSSYVEILDFGVNDAGSFIIVDSTLVAEPAATGEVEFLSQFNTFGSFGLNLLPDEVDIDRHLQLKNSFLSTFQTLFYIRDDIDSGKEFIEQQLYLPTSCYSLPTDRDGLSRISVGIHKPPIPGTQIVTLSKRNVVNPDKLATKRSINKNYYNAIVYKYEDKPLDDELRRRRITLVGTQLIPTGNKPLLIESLGMKSIFGASALADQSAERLLQRYEGAAEYFDGVSAFFRDAIQIVVGDVLVLDPEGLNLIDRESGSRTKPPLLMECVNRDVDIKNGSVRLDLVSTGFNIDARYGLISPASLISKVINQTTFIITDIYAMGPFGPAQYRKWINLNQPRVRVRRGDFTFSFDTVLNPVNSNTVTIQSTPSFTVEEGDILEFSDYNLLTAQQKLVYCSFSDGNNDFADGEKPYVFI